MGPIQVEIGQRFVRVLNSTTRAPVFEVKSILVGIVPAPHAVLVNIRDPLWTRTLACSALVNNSDYEMVERAS